MYRTSSIISGMAKCPHSVSCFYNMFWKHFEGSKICGDGKETSPALPPISEMPLATGTGVWGLAMHRCGKQPNILSLWKSSPKLMTFKIIASSKIIKHPSFTKILCRDQSLIFQYPAKVILLSYKPTKIFHPQKKCYIKMNCKIHF